MPRIELQTEIRTSKELVFDLSRSIDLHKISTSHTNEEVIAGKANGLIGLNETVTWKAKHFGVYQILKSKITAFERPLHFTDEMVKGTFKNFRHEHHFLDTDHGTLMLDYLVFESPLGLLGKLANTLFLKTYLIRLLEKRNSIIKDFAETDQWKMIVKLAEISVEHKGSFNK